MTYTKKSPALLIMWIVPLAVDATISMGLQDSLIKYLGISKHIGGYRIGIASKA